MQVLNKKPVLYLSKSKALCPRRESDELFVQFTLIPSRSRTAGLGCHTSCS